MPRENALTIEQIDALEIPPLPENRRITRDCYYPFKDTSWDNGKREVYALDDALPRWTRDAFGMWMFRGLERTEDETVIVSHGFGGTGKYILKPKTGTVHDAITRIAPLVQSACVSSEQKERTVALLFYRLFDLVDSVEPQTRDWSKDPT